MLHILLARQKMMAISIYDYDDDDDDDDDADDRISEKLRNKAREFVV